MGLLKDLTKSAAGQACLAWTAAQYLRLIRATNRWELRRPPAAATLLDEHQPFVAAFWHGRLATMRAAWPGDPKRFHMLISGHRDGAIVAGAMRRLGFPVVSGSSRRRAAPALRNLCQVLWQGDCVGITPDGPRGPRMRAKLGAVKAAQAAGVPILPVSGAVERCRILKTWDRFLGADVFSRGVVLYGEPIQVPKDADRTEMERLRAELEASLNALTAEADRLCGLTPVEPAPPPALPTAESDGTAADDGIGSADNGLAESDPEALAEGIRHARP